jgi:hypothetical protein
MLSIVRPSFEVVKEGRIFYNPKGFNRLNLVASVTFSGDGQGRRLEEVDVLQRFIAHCLGIEAMQSDSTL